jgi:2-methylcitrate dehydratase PrpD
VTTGAQTLAAFSSSLRFEDLPADVVTATKLHVLDTLGCGLAAHALGAGGEGRAAVADLGEGNASVIGLDRLLPAPNAAFANAMLCHALDYDDTHSDAVAHITVAVAPAAIAVAEATGRSGSDLVTAVAAGTEVVTRIGMTAPSRFHRRGLHPTGVCGVFGATAASARLAGLDADTTASALGLAGSMSSGLLAFLDDGTPTKPLHPAWAAHGGTLAARLAAAGGAGPPSVLEGRFGLYDALIGDRDVPLAEQLADLGERWETLRISYKAYPACHYMHGCLGAAEQLLGDVEPADIDDVLVTVPEAAVALVLEPVEAKLLPRTDYEGKFSLQYSLAALLVHGRVNLATYSAEALGDPDVRALAAKVRYEVRPYPTYPQAFPGGVRITLRNGRVLEAELEHQLGSPQRPMSEDDVRAKFRENAAPALDADSLDALEEALCTLEEQTDLRAVFSRLALQAVPA